MLTQDPLSAFDQTASFLQAISSSPRLKILLAIGYGEACVCHLEARLGYRQAYISQHLMALRQADLLDTRREGKYIFYRLQKPEILDLISNAAEIIETDLTGLLPINQDSQCACPTCTPVVTEANTA
jgi:DNA-binding transcriptional ArsR family regulator